MSLTFLCWQLANIHGFVEDFDSQSQCRRQLHLSFFVVLLQHGHGSLRARSQSIKDQTGELRTLNHQDVRRHGDSLLALLEVQLKFRRQTRWNNLYFNCVHTERWRTTSCSSRTYHRLSIQTYSAIVADTGCLPASVVATGVALIQLETIMFVPAHVEQGNTKWSLPCQDTPKHNVTLIPNMRLLVDEELHTSELCVGLLDVTQSSHQLLTGNRLLVLE